MLALRRSQRIVSFVNDGELRGGWADSQTVWAAVIACVVHIPDDYGSVNVHVANDGRVDVRHRRVVTEGVSRPHSTGVTVTVVTVTVVDASVVADVLSPVALVPVVSVLGRAPVARGVLETRRWWHNPRPGYP